MSVGCVGGVTGLLQDFIVYEHDGVCAENEALRKPPRDKFGFLPGQTLGVVAGKFAARALLGNVGRMDFEGDSGLAQQFLPSRRGGSQNQDLWFGIKHLWEATILGK